MTRLGRFLVFLSALVAVLAPDAQAVNLTTTYSENFDSMGTVGTAAPAGWTFYSISGANTTWTDATGVLAGGFGTPTANATLIVATPPTASSGGQGFNGGLAASPSDRALVTAPTGTNGSAWQLSVTNTSGGSLSGIYLGYDTRRFTAVLTANELPGYWLFYSLDNGTTWTNVAALNPTIATVPNTTGVTTTPPTLITFSSPLANNGTVLLRWVDDNAVQTSPDQIIGLDNVTISATTPINNPVAVSITSPGNGASVGSSFTINATATTTGGTITNVSFYDGATLLATDTTSPYSYAWTGATPGNHALTAVALDSNSNSATSTVVSVTVVSGAGSLLRGPYLQKAAPTQITIRWRGSLSAVGRVRYGTNVSNLNQFVDEAVAPASPFDHVVALTGLTPATTYFYSVGSTTDPLASGADCTFTTPPVAGTVVNTRIWVLGDAGTASASQTAVRDAFYTWTGASTPNLVLQLGDNAYNSGLDTEFQSGMFDIYPTMLRKTPFWSCLGNHETGQSTAFVDTYPYFDIYTFPTAGECGGVSSGTEHYYSFNYGNIHFISLDSMTASRNTIEVNGSDGPMAAWLRTDLASTTATWIVCFFHHPPYTHGSHNSDTETELIEMRTHFLPILEAGGVDLVLSGHSHCYERSYLLDGLYGTSGTLTTAMKKNGGDGRPSGNGAYIKPLTGPRDHFGAVYSVAGSAGQTGGITTMPAHFISLSTLGSLVLDVNGTRLDATFVKSDGTIPDTFTIIKQGAADSDGDGIPDDYEIAHGLNRFNAADALLDSDGDGVSNLNEFIFSTSSNVPDRYAFSTTYNSLAGTSTVTFPTTTGRTYRVMYSNTLLSGSWQAASSSVAGTGATMQWTDDGTTTGSLPSAAGKRFYRIEVTVIP